MTRFDDLSAYGYSDVEIIEVENGSTEFRPAYERINVGWLDASRDFPAGATPGWFRDALLDIVAGPRVNVMRGFHVCDACPATNTMAEAPRGLLLGNAEIRVIAGPGRMFASPNLIWHYVTEHDYRPPADFIEAVKNHDLGWTTEPSPWIPPDAERDRY